MTVQRYESRSPIEKLAGNRTLAGKIFESSDFSMCRIERLEIFDEMEEWHLIQVPPHSPFFPLQVSFALSRPPIILNRVQHGSA
jgi:hypothetical protein